VWREREREEWSERERDRERERARESESELPRCVTCLQFGIIQRARRQQKSV